MKKTGLIRGSTLIIDPFKIGIMHVASIGIEARENEVEEVKRYVEGLKVKNVVIDAWITFGRYNISLAVLLKNGDDVFRIKHMLKDHPAVVNVDVSLTKDFHFNYENLDFERLLE